MSNPELFYFFPMFSGIAKAWTEAYFGEGSGPVLLDEVRCTGNELSIEQCPKSSWGEHNCGHREDAGVSCTPLTGDDDFPLMLSTLALHLLGLSSFLLNVNLLTK